MVMLLAIPVGIAAGYLVRGRLDGLANLHLRWASLAVAGLVVQAVLFSDAGFALAGPAAPAIYVGSTAVVLAAVLRNVRLAGMPIVAAGSISNLAAILANGGSMPADPVALATAGMPVEDHGNSVVLESPALQPLTDIFAIPAGLPFANVFSIGDVLIALGIVILIAAAMRRARSAATDGIEASRVGAPEA
jgi:hypothetical protein